MIIKKVSRSAVVAPLRLRSVRAAWSFYIPPAAPARRWQSVLASPPFGVVGVLLSGAAASRPRLCAVPPLPRAAVRLRRIDGREVSRPRLMPYRPPPRGCGVPAPLRCY